MSILGNMFSRILGRGQDGGTTQAVPPRVSTAAQAPPRSAAPQSTERSGVQTPASATQARGTGAAAGLQTPTAAPAAVPRMDEVDVARSLDTLAAKSGQKLNWRRSIVDLMKLLGMDSSLAQRKALAQELGYTGDAQDSAAMNLWLHQQVLRKLADNGGKVPQDLLH